MLTGPEIEREWRAKRIEIEPFDRRGIEPNSYGFHLGDRLLAYDGPLVDALGRKQTRTILLPESGYLLRKGRFYLGHTLERMGSRHYASELYANLSTAAAGLFIQTSAPLGHTGAVISWTLEILPTHDVRVYPGMLIGKICFWSNCGDLEQYAGRYDGSTAVVASLLSRGEP